MNYIDKLFSRETINEIESFLRIDKVYFQSKHSSNMNIHYGKDIIFKKNTVLITVIDENKILFQDFKVCNNDINHCLERMSIYQFDNQMDFDLFLKNLSHSRDGIPKSTNVIIYDPESFPFSNEDVEYTIYPSDYND